MPTGVYVRTKEIWNKGLTKETDERVRKVSEKLKGKPSGMKDKHQSEKVKERIREFNKGKVGYYKGKKRPEHSEMMSGRIGINSSGWKGGCRDYWHEQAWNKFGKDSCEMCGMSNKEHIQSTRDRLHMHCVGGKEMYHIQTKENWICLCNKCHPKIHNSVDVITERQ